MPLGRVGFPGIGPLTSLGQSSKTKYEGGGEPPTPPGEGITQEDDFYFLTENGDYFITD
jgi:hypothetical protein